MGENDLEFRRVFITSLKPSTNYDLIISASNEASTTQAQYAFSTFALIKGKAPMPLKVNSLRSNSIQLIRLVWKPNSKTKIWLILKLKRSFPTRNRHHPHSGQQRGIVIQFSRGHLPERRIHSALLHFHADHSAGHFAALRSGGQKEKQFGLDLWCG